MEIFVHAVLLTLVLPTICDPRSTKEEEVVAAAIAIADRRAEEENGTIDAPLPMIVTATIEVVAKSLWEWMYKRLSISSVARAWMSFKNST
jgi:hypothetical protein